MALKEGVLIDGRQLDLKKAIPRKRGGDRPQMNNSYIRGSRRNEWSRDEYSRRDYGGRPPYMHRDNRYLPSDGYGPRDRYDYSDVGTGGYGREAYGYGSYGGYNPASRDPYSQRGGYGYRSSEGYEPAGYTGYTSTGTRSSYGGGYGGGYTENNPQSNYGSAPPVAPSMQRSGYETDGGIPSSYPPKNDSAKDADSRRYYEPY